jgi:dihydrofolate reductase
MRKVFVTMFLTLDGVMEAPNLWSFPYWCEEIAKFKFDELFGSDAMLLGRVTYQGFAAAWPSQQDENTFAERMNSLPKYVVSTTLTSLEWKNSRLLQGDIAQGVSALKQQSGQDIMVAGSADLVSTLRRLDLIDEYRLLVYPILVGSGKRLFKDGSEIAKLKLVETKTFGTGVVLMRYEPARDAG